MVRVGDVEASVRGDRQPARGAKRRCRGRAVVAKSLVLGRACPRYCANHTVACNAANAVIAGVDDVVGAVWRDHNGLWRFEKGFSRCAAVSDVRRSASRHGADDEAAGSLRADDVVKRHEPKANAQHHGRNRQPPVGESHFRAGKKCKPRLRIDVSRPYGADCRSR